jgi:plastocyanin
MFVWRGHSCPRRFHWVAGEKAAGKEITIDNFSFGPQNLSVKAGTQVTWVNLDDIPHTVVSEDLTTFRSRARSIPMSRGVSRLR